MRILFYSRAGAIRSQMAAGIATQMLGSSHNVATAGLELQAIHPLAVTLMQEINIDISQQPQQTLAAASIEEFDIVVQVGSPLPSDQKPQRPSLVHWPIPDPLDPPAGQAELEKRLREVRTALSKHLKQMLKQLDAAG